MNIGVYNGHLELFSSPVGYLWQPDDEDAVCQLGSCFTHTNRPAQWDKSVESAITALGAQMGSNSLA
jgi:hypothetical protein